MRIARIAPPFRRAVPRPRAAVLALLGLGWLGGAALAGEPGGTPAATPAGAAAKPCKAEFVAADVGERSSRFLAWLKQQGGNHEEVAYQDDMDTVLFADVDNDGGEEAVVLSHGGTLRALDLDVFRPSGEGWIRVPLPVAGPAFNDEKWLIRDWEGFDEGLRHTRLLVRFCGKTYINLSGGIDPNHYPETYVWERNRTRKVCDSAWLAEERRLFQDLFDRRLYDEAHSFLDGVQGFCAAEAKGRAPWLWMQSDLALTAYKMGTYDTCLRHVAAARRSPGFGRAGEALTKALAANAALCTAGKQRGPDLGYDFSWLRDVPEHRQVVLDPRFNGLLSAVAPDVRLADEDGEALRDVLRLHVWVGGVGFVGDRYAVIEGYESHRAENTGAIWIDMVTKDSILILDRSIVASKTVPAAKVPPKAWEELEFLPGDEVKYLEPNGRWKKVTVPGTRAPSR